MEIAMFFSGRISDRNLTQLQRLRERYNIFFFVSVNPNAQTQKTLSTFIKTFYISPFQLNVETITYPDYIYNVPRRQESNPERVYSMFYHNYKAFGLIEEYEKKYKTKFDTIIKYRDDIIPKGTGILNLDFIDKDLPLLYIPMCKQYAGINDQIAIGNTTIMKEYTSAFKMLKGYFEKNSNLVFNPEVILKYHTEQIGLEIKKIKFFYNLQKKI